MPLKNLNDFKSEVIENENVIVGSGAGGSTVAYELLKKNKDSIILEEGPNINEINKSNIGISIANLYKNNGQPNFFIQRWSANRVWSRFMCGGSTYVNAGYFSGTPEWVYNQWLKQERLKLPILNFKNSMRRLNQKLMFQLKI